MFLLILKKHDNYYVAGPVFTFHNVSINTGTGTNATIDSIIFTFHNVSINTKAICGQLKIEVSLHSTMFLLIPNADYKGPQTKETLHSTMFLLILGADPPFLKIICFTFHNVSINTDSKRLVQLFNLLYIPQCFY